MQTKLNNVLKNDQLLNRAELIIRDIERLLNKKHTPVETLELQKKTDGAFLNETCCK